MALTRRVLFAASALLPASGLRAQGEAAGFPDRPVRLVVPFPPGGATDQSARLLAAEMQGRLGQPVVVDNRGGAAGTIGVEHVVRSQPDGYTLLFHTSALALDPSLKANLPYSVENDLAPITLAARGAYVLVAGPKVPAKDLRSLIALAKSKPGEIHYGSPGVGSSSHLITEMFAARAGLQLTHVPYRGGGPAVAGLLSGEIQLFVDAVQTARPLVQDGQVNAIGVTTAERAALMPAVPTLAEGGLDGFGVGYWHGILAPAATPPARVAKLGTAFREVIAQPAMRQRLTELGLTPVANTPEEFRATLLADIASWRDVIRAADIRLE